MVVTSHVETELKFMPSHISCHRRYRINLSHSLEFDRSTEAALIGNPSQKYCKKASGEAPYHRSSYEP